MRFSRKFLDAQHGSGGEAVGRTGNPACEKNSGGRSRRATRGERGKLPLRVRGRCASMRLHAGFMMDPTPARGPGSRSSPFRMRKTQGFGGLPSPCREIPHAPQTRSPRLPKDRRRNGREADRGPGDQMEGKGRRGADVRPLARMRGTRHARYLQTLPQPYSYAAYLTQLYSYAEYATAAILRRYSLLQLYSHHILTTPFPLTSSPPHSKLATALPHSLRKEIYKETGLPRPFSPPNEWLAPPQLRSPRSLRSFASLSSRM